MKHILIDFENIHPTAEQLMELDNDCQIWLFLGKHQQKNIPLALAEALCRFNRTHFIRVEKTGKNALDFYLAYYLGRIIEQDANAEICILSKDGGYDVLVEHLDSQQHCQQIMRITWTDTGEQKFVDETTVPVIEEKPVTASSEAANCFRQTVQYFIPPTNFKPKSLGNLKKRLKSFVVSETLSVFNDDEQNAIIDHIIARLEKAEIIKINNGLVSYFVSPEALRNIWVNRLRQSKPKSYEGARNVLSNTIQGLGFSDVTDDKIMQLIDYCVKKKWLIINGDKLVYPPFSPQTLQTQYTAEEIAKANHIKEKLVKMESKKRPQKLVSLSNHIRSHHKSLSEAETEKIIRLLCQKRHIKILETGKIQYFMQ